MRRNGHLSVWVGRFARSTRVIALGVLAMVQVGCVTEKRTYSSTFHGVPVVESPRGSAPSTARPTTSVELPAGPVAKPAETRATVSRVRVEVAPLGAIEYDGQVLPLVSPDSRFIAAQVGLAPTWETQLATPGASVPLGTRMEVYELPAVEDIRRGRVFGPAPVSYPEPLERGLLLGRGCDRTGFLVEAPRADGSRWIGKVGWVNGRVTWLVRDDLVSAHATLTAGGDLAFIRRGVSSAVADLVLQSGGRESVARASEVAGEADAAFTFPMAGADPDVLYAILHTSGGIDLVAFRLVRSGGDLGAPRVIGQMVARQHLTDSGGLGIANQIAAPVQPALPVDGRNATVHPFVILHPAFGRMAEFDLQTASFSLLPDRSIAAARIASGSDARAVPGGWFVTTPDGLVFSADREGADPRAPRHDARVLADPVVPRATLDPVRQMVLLGPDPRDPLRLTVSVMRVAGAEPSP